MLPEMALDGLADNLPESDWDSIPDHPADRLDPVFTIRLHELVVPRESLKNRALAKRYCAILLGVAKPSIAETIELCRDRRGWVIPFHTAIDTRIRLASLRLVAFGD